MSTQQSNRFTQTRDAAGTVLTVIDSTTGLEWLAAPLPQGRLTQEKAIDACAALEVAGHTDWTLPTRQQLLSLVDLTRYSPAIDTDAFPDFPSSWFWTSDPCALHPATAWGVGFSKGYVDDLHRDDSGFALAVRRAGQ